MYQQTNSMEYSMAKKNLFGLQCACCGSDITAPQFYNGQMYGYTCITKVAPKQKKNKVADLLIIPFETIEDNFKNFIPYNKPTIRIADRIGYRFTLSTGLRLFVRASRIYVTIAGVTPRSETEFVYGGKVHIDYEKKVLITPRDFWEHETLYKLRDIPGIQGDFKHLDQ